MLDDPSQVEGDTFMEGVNEFDAPENLRPGQVQAATNIDFTKANADTRGGLVCLPALASSPFGLTWTARTSAADNSWYGVAFGSNLFAAVSLDGASRVMTSPDGSTWTSRSAGAANQWVGITFGGGLFVSVAISGVGNRVQTSPDGITWTARTSAGDHTWLDVTYGNGTYVAVGYSGVNTGRVMTSTDGSTWTLQGSIPNGNWTSVAYGNGLFVAVSSESGVGGVMTSPDGATWTSRTPASTSSWTGIAYGNGTFVATGNSGAVMYSTTGTSWTTATAAANNDWQRVAYGGGVFVAVSSTGSGNRVMSSPNGISWSSNTSAANNDWRSVAYGNGVFAAVSDTGTGNRVQTAGTSATTFAFGRYSDPNVPEDTWMVLAKATSATFHAFGRTSRTVDYPAGYTLSELATIVQANNYLIIMAGEDLTPIRWDGNWNNDFETMPATTLGAGFESIPHSNHALYYVNRLWAKEGKDKVAASDLLEFDDYDDIFNEFNLNVGTSDYVVCTYPFGVESILVFKNQSIQLLQNVAGALDDVVATEVTRQVGIVGINAVVSVGPDVVYMSDRNINLISLTSTSNSVQHQAAPLSRNIEKLMRRVNWAYAYKVSMAYWDNKLYVALPLDGSTNCNAVAVYNFITGQWWGEWTFAESLNMKILGFQTSTYFGQIRLHAATEDGRIFVVGEGHQDISGTTEAEVSTSVTTRGYRLNNNNTVSRRMWADLSTNRPTFSITAYADGANEYSEITSDQTFSRSASWIFGDSTYSLTNSGDNYNRAGRKDYAGLCSESIQPQSGFLPEITQDYRFPVITRRKGRLHWLKVENTTGRLTLNGIGTETRPGDRGNLVQVI